MGDVATWAELIPTPFRLNPFFAILCFLLRSSRKHVRAKLVQDGWLGLGLLRPAVAAASHGFGVEIPPFHAEVLGVGFGILSILTKLSKGDQSLCMGWGFRLFWQFCQNWPKLAACLTCESLFVSDTQRVLVISAKMRPKLAAYLTKCRGLGTDPFGVGRLTTSFGC